MRGAFCSYRDLEEFCYSTCLQLFVYNVRDSSFSVASSSSPAESFSWKCQIRRPEPDPSSQRYPAFVPENPAVIPLPEVPP